MTPETPTYDALLQKAFSLPKFRLGQREIIASILDKKDVLAVLPTGGGKSLCYQFPAVYTNKLVIVISPLIALMKDQVMSLRRQGIPAGCLHSGQSEDDKRAVFAEINQGGSFLLYLSPERVQKEGFQRWIMQRDIALFAIDEAHCVSQWGHDFREEYGQLRILKALRPDVPVLALTASATPTVLADVSRNLCLHKPERRVHGFYRPNLYYQVEFCADEDAKLSLLIQSLKQTPEGRVIVYCGTRRITEQLAQTLALSFEQVGYYHAGLGNKERTRMQEAYAKGELRILVATNAFGMGIDQPDVRLVVHFQMPGSIDSLYQEMGRAGRDGLPSTCLMLYARKDKGLQSYFIESGDLAVDIKRSRWRTLEALVNYTEGSECRHAEILTYYKDAQRIDKCGHCDTCDPQSSRKITKPLVQKSAPVTKTVKGRKSKNGAAELELNAAQEVLFQSLKRWRKEKAQELDVPAFVVFSDQTLKHLAIRQPQSMDQLKDVYGIGESKMEKFGWDVLSLIEQN